MNIVCGAVVSVHPPVRKLFSKYAPETFEAPNLVQVQLDSYKWFFDVGLKELMKDVSPIVDWTEKELELRFLDFKLDEPKYSERQSREKNITYEAPLRVKISLTHKASKKVQDQEIYLADFPLMTPRGTFVINGVERVVISQLIRSPGVFFTINKATPYQKYFGAKIIPSRGAWLEFETESNGAIFVRIDRKRKIAATAMLRAFGIAKDDDIKKLFADIDTSEMHYIISTILQDPSSTEEEGLIEMYKRIRPGDPANVDNARQMINNMFKNFTRYDLSRVGRHRMNQRFLQTYPLDETSRTLKVEDIIDVLREIIKLNNDPSAIADNIDHLGNRRVKTLGELLQDKLRLAFSRMERTIKDRMSTQDMTTVIPAALINARPFVAAVKEFFSSGQLSQFMDQVNPLAELEHKRRMSAMGPGGLTRERASFEVRDVHPSHYGRICPIQTPEGPNIGLVSHLALFSKISPLGFILTPYRKVVKGVATDEIEYLDATEEERHVIAHAGTLFDAKGHFKDELVAARIRGEVGLAKAEEVTLLDVSSKQPFSVATSLIPFLENDDANRALMGSNMQRQAVPIIQPEAPIVGTGLEAKVARDSGMVVIAEQAGTVEEADGNHIVILTDKGEKITYNLMKFVRSNNFTAINQRPLVKPGQKVKHGEPLADGPATEGGELALGRNLVVAFMSFEGANFEDAVVLSERLVKEDWFTSIHIEDYSIDVRETKLGEEITTYDIPNRSEAKLKDLDPDGIVRIGAEVRSQDILVGKISPKGENDLTAEERLLKAIFGEKSRDVKDASLTLDHGKVGRVVGVKVFSRDAGDKLPAGVIKTIQVSVARMRKVQVGDKLAGRHGNKGVISTILPEEDMPFLPDGKPVDMILSPLGIFSRMNIGQVLETHLGWAASKLGYKAAVPSMAGPTEQDITDELIKAGLPEDGKLYIYDGRTGQRFEQKTTVGVIYFMKLMHMVEDKLHMRSIGPYSLITQQPLGGKAQFGGQRFGEMEVWALEGYGAAHTLQEMLTIKSDDVQGRAKTYESIINGEEIKAPHLPESFKVLLSEIKGLGLNIELMEQ